MKRGANNSSKVSLLNLQDQQEVTANQIKPKASQSDTNMTKMHNLEEAHLALSVSRSRIEHQENILAALENRVSSLFNDSGEFSKIKFFEDHGGLPNTLSKTGFQIDADQLVPWLVEREVVHRIENPSASILKTLKVEETKIADTTPNNLARFSNAAFFEISSSSVAPLDRNENHYKSSLRNLRAHQRLHFDHRFSKDHQPLRQGQTQVWIVKMLQLTQERFLLVLIFICQTHADLDF